MGVGEEESKHVKYASDDGGSEEESEDDSWFNDMLSNHMKVVEHEEQDESPDGLPLDIDLESQWTDAIESQWRLAEPKSPRPSEDPCESDSHEKVVEEGESNNSIVLEVPESPEPHDAKHAGDPLAFSEEEKAARVRLLNMKLRHIELELQEVERRCQLV